LCSFAAQGHDPAGVRALHGFQQQAGEREVAQVVGAELELEPVARGLLRRHHHAGVVDQQIDPLSLEPAGELAHRVEAAEIECEPAGLGPAGFRLDLVRGGLTFVDAPGGDDHLGAVARQLERGDTTEPTVGAGHDRELAGLVGDVTGRPLGSHRSGPSDQKPCASPRRRFPSSPST